MKLTKTKNLEWTQSMALYKIMKSCVLKQLHQTTCVFLKYREQHISAFLFLWVISFSSALLSTIKKQAGTSFNFSFDGNTSSTSLRLLITSSVSVLFSVYLLRYIIHLHNTSLGKHKLRKDGSVTTPSKKGCAGIQQESHTPSQWKNIHRVEGSNEKMLSALSSASDVYPTHYINNGEGLNSNNTMDENVSSMAAPTQTSETQTEGLTLTRVVSIGVITTSIDTLDQASNSSHRPHSIARAVGTFTTGMFKKRMRRALKTLDEMKLRTKLERQTRTKEWRSSIKRYSGRLQKLSRLVEEKNKLVGYICSSRLASQKDVEIAAQNVRSLREKLNHQCQENEEQCTNIKSKTAILRTISQFIGAVPGIADNAFEL